MCWLLNCKALLQKSILETQLPWILNLSTNDYSWDKFQVQLKHGHNRASDKVTKSCWYSWHYNKYLMFAQQCKKKIKKYGQYQFLLKMQTGNWIVDKKFVDKSWQKFIHLIHPVSPLVRWSEAKNTSSPVLCTEAKERPVNRSDFNHLLCVSTLIMDLWNQQSWSAIWQSTDKKIFILSWIFMNRYLSLQGTISRHKILAPLKSAFCIN